MQIQYVPKHVYGMEEIIFAFGVSRSSRALVNIREDNSWKQIESRLDRIG